MARLQPKSVTLQEVVNVQPSCYDWSCGTFCCLLGRRILTTGVILFIRFSRRHKLAAITRDILQTLTADVDIIIPGAGQGGC